MSERTVSERTVSEARRAAVVGAGAWGTTFACLLAEAGTPTTLWARRERPVAVVADRGGGRAPRSRFACSREASANYEIGRASCRERV